MTRYLGRRCRRSRLMGDSREQGASVQRAKEGADRHLRLVEALEALARAEEDAAAALDGLELPDQAGVLRDQAAHHLRWATDVAHEANTERERQFELLRDADEL